MKKTKRKTKTNQKPRKNREMPTRKELEAWPNLGWHNEVPMDEWTPCDWREFARVNIKGK